jgi:hypothetical protein
MNTHIFTFFEYVCFLKDVHKTQQQQHPSATATAVTTEATTAPTKLLSK